MSRPFEMLVGVLHHDHARVDHDADRDGDSSERHDVRVDAEGVHDQERREETDRQGEDRHESAAEVEEEQDAHERNDDHLLRQLASQDLDRLPDKGGPIVDGNDLDTLGKPCLELLELRFDAFDCGQSVLAEAHDDHAAHRLAFAVQLCETSAQFGPEADLGNITNQDRNTVGAHADRHVLHILQCFEVPEAPDHVFRLGHLHEPSADIVIASADRRNNT